MLKYLLYSDTQVRPHGEFSKPVSSGLTTYLQSHLDSCKWVADVIVDELPTYVINLGDSVDNPFAMDAATVTALHLGDTLIYNACKYVKANKLVLLGNHDFSSLACKMHAIPFFRGEIISSWHRIALIGTGIYHYFYPWGSEVFDYHPDDSLIFCHFDLKGVPLNTNKISTSGFDILKFGTPRQIFAGHHHVPYDSGNLHIVGALNQYNFGDENSTILNGIIIYEYTDNIIRRIPNPFANIFKTLSSNDIGTVTSPDRTFVRVSVDGLPSDDIKAQLSKFKGSRLSSKPKVHKLAKKIDVDYSMGPQKVISEYIKATDFGGINKERLSDTLYEICGLEH